MMGVAENTFVWLPLLGMGFHNAPAIEYDDAYFENYVHLDETDTGAALTRARVDFVRQYWAGSLIDIGVGAGRFCVESGAMGFDVNPRAVAMLKQSDIYQDPYQQRVNAICCWDSLEHIPAPDKLVDQVDHWVFVSMPIYQSMADVLVSKHYKPGEHLWYWTHEGLLRWFQDLGFGYVTHNQMESDLGREGIKTYAFKRIRPA